MSYLLGFGLQDAYLSEITKSWPKLKLGIEDFRKQGLSPMQAAVNCLAIVLQFEIENRIPCEDWPKVEEYLTKSVGEPKYKAEKAAGYFFAQAYVQVDLGNVEAASVARAAHEIVGTLQGIPKDVRVAQRLTTALTKGD
ncbi:hypothetical protein [Phenylobacterium sp.]|uniref:hypothetical protein n=1 Tax=Phenylobacterium sp. TaxID=1871053 RepID=UPI002C471785|nr:hypothetical protein [Phenylobacterium sp.]HLZ73816.1 hypothetical protein [Phenylobacterium sp.]